MNKERLLYIGKNITGIEYAITQVDAMLYRIYVHEDAIDKIRYKTINPYNLFVNYLIMAQSVDIVNYSENANVPSYYLLVREFLNTPYINKFINDKQFLSSAYQVINTSNKNTINVLTLPKWNADKPIYHDAFIPKSIGHMMVVNSLFDGEVSVSSKLVLVWFLNKKQDLAQVLLIINGVSYNIPTNLYPIAIYIINNSRKLSESKLNLLFNILVDNMDRDKYHEAVTFSELRDYTFEIVKASGLDPEIIMDMFYEVYRTVLGIVKSEQNSRGMNKLQNTSGILISTFINIFFNKVNLPDDIVPKWSAKGLIALKIFD